MKLLSLTFALDVETGDSTPDTVTVTMSIREAAAIAGFVGSMNGHAHERLGIDSAVYDCLVGDVFNRYWDDGLDDATRELCVSRARIDPVMNED